MAEALKQEARPGDLILVSPWYYGVALQRYYTNHFDTLPPMAEDIRIHRYDLMKKQMMAENPIGPLLEQARQTLRSGHVFWVVGDFQFPPPGQPQPLLPPYREDMVHGRARRLLFSSWMFQFSQMVQSHATSRLSGGAFRPRRRRHQQPGGHAPAAVQRLERIAMPCLRLSNYGAVRQRRPTEVRRRPAALP